jgi:hypothetical protein
MSVLCTFTNGWVISHDHFIRSVYETGQGIPNRRFALDSSLFQINTPFIRSAYTNKNNSVAEINSSASPPRKRRKKRRNGTENTDVNDVS